MPLLRDLDVLVLDCQAGGATPAHGDLLELGWAISGAERERLPARAHWIVPQSDRPVSRIVRQLTGWTDACLDEAIEPARAWKMLLADASAFDTRDESEARPTVIHFARFELPFLRALHETDPASPFPFDPVCLHAISQRLFPDLPRRNLRALAGHLGHSPELVRRCAGHVEASACIWRAVLPRLDALGVTTWPELKTWLEEPAPSSRARRGRPGYPLPAERRRALPDVPGVYRFLRPNGDVLYVGKAASLKKRVASHFTTTARATERALEMLTQAHDVEVTPTATALEAALLETDEIKRLDPPYNVQLRGGDRQAWFASRDWMGAAPAPDEVHAVGPLPSRRAVAGIGAMRALLEGAAVSDELCAAALGVSPRFAPELAMFVAAWTAFATAHLGGAQPARTRLLRAASTIDIVEADDSTGDDDDAPPDGWDEERIVRALERTVVQEGLLVRRARALSLLTHASIVYREPRSAAARRLFIERGMIERSDDVTAEAMSETQPLVPPPSRRMRQASFDAALYDRLRVLATELRRVAEQGGVVAICIGRRVRDSRDVRARRR